MTDYPRIDHPLRDHPLMGEAVISADCTQTMLNATTGGTWKYQVGFEMSLEGEPDLSIAIYEHLESTYVFSYEKLVKLMDATPFPGLDSKDRPQALSHLLAIKVLSQEVAKRRPSPVKVPAAKGVN